MFIDRGSFVVVKDSGNRPDLAGRFGVVSRIRIIAETGYVMVFVDLYDPATGDSPCYMFEPADLMRRPKLQTTAKRVRDLDMDQIEQLQRIAA